MLGNWHRLTHGPVDLTLVSFRTPVQHGRSGHSPGPRWVHITVPEAAAIPLHSAPVPQEASEAVRNRPERRQPGWAVRRRIVELVTGQRAQVAERWVPMRPGLVSVKPRRDR